MNKDEPLATLTRDDLIALFEWAYRFCETKKLEFSHPAEAIVVDKIASDLERVMAEPFAAEYPETLTAARGKIVAEYAEKMGAETWISALFPKDRPSST